MPAVVAAFMQVRSRYLSDLVKAYWGKLQSSGSSAWFVLSFAAMYCCRSCAQHTFNSIFRDQLCLQEYPILYAGVQS